MNRSHASVLALLAIAHANAVRASEPTSSPSASQDEYSPTEPAATADPIIPIVTVAEALGLNSSLPGPRSTHTPCEDEPQVKPTPAPTPTPSAEKGPDDDELAATFVSDGQNKQFKLKQAADGRWYVIFLAESIRLFPSYMINMFSIGQGVKARSTLAQDTRVITLTADHDLVLEEIPAGTLSGSRIHLSPVLSVNGKLKAIGTLLTENDLADAELDDLEDRIYYVELQVNPGFSIYLPIRKVPPTDSPAPQSPRFMNFRVNGGYAIGYLKGAGWRSGVVLNLTLEQSF